MKKITFDAKNPTHSIIWLHGLGAGSDDFAPLAKMLGVIFKTVRFVLPEAPLKPVSLNNHSLMSSWFDILDLANSRAINTNDLTQSSKDIIAIIEQEHQEYNIPYSNIILAGFSQGGVVALHVAFSEFPESLGGVLALSTWSPSFSHEHSINEKQRKTPVFIAHGDYDDILPIIAGEHARDFLLKNNVQVNWNKYSMMHEVSEDEVQDIIAFLQNLGIESSYDL